MQEHHNRKKTARIWTASILAGILLCAGILNLAAKHQLKTALADIPGAQISVEKIRLSLFARNVELKDVAFAVRDTTDAGPDIEGSVKALKLQHVHWFRLLKGEARANRLLIREPVTRIVLKAPRTETPDSTQAPEPFLKKVSLAECKVEDGKIQLCSKADSTRASAQKINLSVSGIALTLPEGIFAFNDSTCRAALDSLDYRDAQGLTRYRIGHLATVDAGPIEAQDLHLFNCVKQEEVAERMGKVAAMWFDVKLDSLSTSAINIPRMIESKRVDIDDIRIAGAEATIFQDDRYPPAVPYGTLQEGINALGLPLNIKHIGARLNTFTFIWETTHINRGTFPMDNVLLDVKSVSNAPGNVMELALAVGRPKLSQVNVNVSVKNDKRESTHGNMKALGLEASKLDSFTRPLFGATVQADFRQIDCSFKGDKERMSSNFCMIYDNLKVKAWNDANAPVKFVAKNSGFTTFLANLMLPKANPAVPGKEPKRVQTTFERNPMQPYPAYLVQGLTTGMLHTLLPGGKVHQTKKQKP